MRYPSLLYQKQTVPTDRERSGLLQALCPGDWCEEPLVMLGLFLFIKPQVLERLSTYSGSENC